MFESLMRGQFRFQRGQSFGCSAWPVSWAAALAMAASSHATAAPLSSGFATLSAFNYRLIDLDPDDGVTPSLTLDTGTTTLMIDQGQWYNRPPPEVDYLDGGPFSKLQGSLERPSAHSLASVSPGGLHVSSGAHEGDEHRLSVEEWFTEYFHSHAGGNFDHQLILSPRTKLVVEGAVTAESRTDLSSLTDSGILAAHGGKYSTLNAYHQASVGIFLMASEAPDASFEAVVRSGQVVAAEGVRDLTFDTVLYKAYERVETPFSVSLSNTDRQPLASRFYAAVGSRSTLMATPVPEPDVALLALLGAGVVTQIRKRRPLVMA